MTASNQLISISGNHNNLVMIQPTNFAELDRYCTLIAKSSFCPKSFAGKPGDVMVALQMGAEVGLSPMQAIQNIAVINGKPCLWGDGALAVVMASPNYQHHKEWITGDIKDETLTAHCLIKRRGSDDYTYSFSMQDAKKAGLWGKPGVWQQYPNRMLQNRARGFALRDKFADALRGINIREEVEDYVKIKDVTPSHNMELHKQAAEHHAKLNKLDDETKDLEVKFHEFMIEIENCESLELLQEIFSSIKNINFRQNPEYLKLLINAKDSRKSQLLAKKIDSLNAETGEGE